MTIKLEDYNKKWAEQYIDIKNELWPHMGQLAIGIEHVGSTSVIGVKAKPVIDIDVIVSSQLFYEELKTLLEKLNYEHQDDQVVLGREVFINNKHKISHRLYVCTPDSLALKNHLTFRNMLNQHKDLVELYNEVKTNSANNAKDEDEYCKMKTSFIIEVLRHGGFSQIDLDKVQEIN